MKSSRLGWHLSVIVGCLIAIYFFSPSGPIMDDADLEKLMEEGKSAEALSWAKEAEGTKELRTIHELDNEESLEIIQRLYDLGAVRVTAVDIESEPGYGETTNTLIVELPEDGSLRKQLFDYESKHAGGLGFGGVDDVKQKYLLFWWT